MIKKAVSYLTKTYNRYLTSMIYISLLSLALAMIYLPDFGKVIYFISFIATYFAAYFVGNTNWNSTLMRLQIYLLIPTIIAYASVDDHTLINHMLSFATFVLTNLICATELTKRNQNFFKSSELSKYFQYGGVVFLILIAISITHDRVAAILQIVNSLFLYLLTVRLITEPQKQILHKYDPALVLKSKIIALCVLVVAQFFIVKPFLIVIIIAAAFALIVTSLIFHYRNNVQALCILFGGLVILHFLPAKHLAHLDLSLISLVSLLFYFPNYILYERETEYGRLKVKYDYRSNEVVLYNNNILHGEQYYTPEGEPPADFWYYGNSNHDGPIYELYADTNEKNLAMVGLGLGALSSYGRSNQNITFYELNPEVKFLATNRAYFSFLADCKAKLEFVIGDARQTLEKAKDGEYGIILVDAYSGKYVPKCFLTTQAMQLYFRKLNKQGYVIIHITTGEKGIESLIGKVTNELGLAAYITFVDEYSAAKDSEFKSKGMFVYKTTPNFIQKLVDKVISRFSMKGPSKSSRCLSQWVIIARTEADMPPSIENRYWHRLRVMPDQELYTDEKIAYNQHIRGSVS